MQNPSLWHRVLAWNKSTSGWYERSVDLVPPREYYAQRLNALIAQADTAVHLGAGGKNLADMTTVDLSDKKIYAVDPSPESLGRNPNPNKLEAWGHSIPLPDASVDLIFSEYLMEHVEQTEGTLAEARRLLRPGGKLLWLAPNLWSYSGLITHWTPVSFHKLVTRWLEPVQIRKASADVFPTWFRINSMRAIKSQLVAAGLELDELYMVSDAPHYTSIAPGIHQLAVGLHILLDRVEALQAFRINMIVEASKR